MPENRKMQYVSENTLLTAEWNWGKNGNLRPENYLLNSNKKIWWKCSEGHEWQAIVANRNKGYRCPYCSGRYAVKGVNDLQTVAPMLAKEWNYEKNIGLTPVDVLPYSSKKVWWRCENGHEWQATIANRSKGNGCPYCAGQLVLQGYNDLLTTNPVLAREWNYEKNDGLTPENVSCNSGKLIWWKCNKGHEWNASIYHRNKGQGCPVCDSERRTSFPEYALIYYLSRYGIEAIHSYKEQGYELDVYLPLFDIAIEYDGYFWHKNKMTHDLEKNHKCNSDGITLYRIREGLMPLDDISIDYVIRRDRKDLPTVIAEIISNLIGKKVDIDLQRDAIAIEELREHSEKAGSIQNLNPEIAKEWNFKRNGKLTPESFTANSNKVVWWECSRGHEWQSQINNRSSGNGCPYCSGRYVLIGENDLQTKNPELAKEWNYEKNSGLTPRDVKPNSHKMLWWKCSQGHEWQATVAHRNRGRGCPYCAGYRVTKGVNDLYTINPNLAEEWNYEKNTGITPTDVMPSSHKKVWWKCSQGHEWQAAISDRNRGRSCPKCARKKDKKK